MVPVGLTHAFHILQPTLKKMVTDKVIKGPQIRIGDMIELEDLSSNIIVARNERDDYMPALLEGMVRNDTGYKLKMQTSGLTANV